MEFTEKHPAMLGLAILNLIVTVGFLLYILRHANPFGGNKNEFLKKSSFNGTKGNAAYGACEGDALKAAPDEEDDINAEISRLVDSIAH